MIRLALGAVVFILAAYGDQASDRAKLAGSWRMEKDSGTIWTLQQNGETMHITYSQNGQKVADWECNTMGRECDIEDGGRTAKVTLYFNGAKMVELETRGSDVLKRRFEVTGTGDTMKLELIPISPSGKPETMQFRRMGVAAERR